MQTLSQKLAGRPHADVVTKAIAAEAVRLPPRMDVSDIESAAWLAYHRFMDGPYAGLPDEDLRGSLYVSVRSAIKERKRSVDPLGRFTRRRVRRLAQVRLEIERATGREPTVGEIAAAAGVRESVASRALGAAKAEASESGMHHEDWMTPLDADSEPSEAVDSIGAADVIQAELNKLSFVAQHLIRCSVMGETPLAEVARDLGMSSFKAGQVRDQALRRLRATAVMQELSP